MQQSTSCYETMALETKQMIRWNEGAGHWYYLKAHTKGDSGMAEWTVLFIASVEVG